MSNEERGYFRSYVPRDFNEGSLTLIDQANKILDEYAGKGFTVTLRQLYYQFVARGLLENSDRNYARLGSILSDARLAGLVSWTAIEDRTRRLRGVQSYRGPKELLEQARASFATDLWATQPWRPEVWIEKEALAGVVEGICNTLRVDFFACRGYNSQSEQWAAGQRLAGYVQKGQRPIVFHLGDHDPSGIDMTRDNQERLSMFVGVPVMVVRLALNMEQIRRLNPPPNPAKLSDTRATSYIAKYGDESWELDALDPQTISDLIETSVMRIRDEVKWDRALAIESDGRDTLNQIIEDLDF